MARQWTTEQREKQAAMIRQWQPWQHSTGARTPEGKAISSQNVFIGQMKRKAALTLALQELCAIQAKIKQLTRKRGA
jgi:pantothenate synthetase